MENLKRETCKECGKTFTLNQKSKQKFCADNCRNFYLSKCNQGKGRPKGSKKTTPGAKEIQRLNEWKKTNTISIKIPIYDAGLIIKSLAYAAKSAEIIDDDVFRMGSLAQFIQHMISREMVQTKSS